MPNKPESLYGLTESLAEIAREQGPLKCSGYKLHEYMQPFLEGVENPTSWMTNYNVFTDEIRKPSLQSKMSIEHDVALWQGEDKLFRLIDVRIPPDEASAFEHMEQLDPSETSQCSFCLLDESGTNELQRAHTHISKKRINGQTHEACAHVYSQTYYMAESYKRKQSA